MSQRPPVIDYATPPGARRWWVLPVVRESIALTLWATVFGGGFGALAGAASFSQHGTVSLAFFGVSVESILGRFAWTVLFAALGAAAFLAARWHARHWDADMAARGPAVEDLRA